MVEPRLYILGGLALIAVVMFATAIVATSRYKRAVQRADLAMRQAHAMASHIAAPSSGEPAGFPAEPMVPEELPADLPAWATRQVETPEVQETADQSDGSTRQVVAPSPLTCAESTGASPSEPEPVWEAPVPSERVEPALPGPVEPSPELSLLDEVPAERPRQMASPIDQGSVVVAEDETSSDDVTAILAALTVGDVNPATVAIEDEVPLESSDDAPARPARNDVEPYALVAPVELHFTIGEGRVGVRPGTRTYAEFQRMAGVILGDLERARRQ